MNPVPHFVEIVASIMVVSVVAGLLTFPMLNRWPPGRWLDHPNPYYRWPYRICLSLGCLLLPLSLSWLAATISLNCCTNAFLAVPLGLIQIAVLAVPLICCIPLYLALAKYVRKRANGHPIAA